MVPLIVMSPRGARGIKHSSRIQLVRRVTAPSTSTSAALTFVAALTGCSSSDEAPSPYPPACYAREDLTIEVLCERTPGLCGAATGALPSLGPSVTVVPDKGALPTEVVSQAAHNNLDIAWHGGRLYFAFRTAPSHFASWQTVLYVVSTTDQKRWTYETQVALETDVREPRFLEVNGELHLYFAVLGDNPLAFKPQGMRGMKLVHGCVWTAPEELRPMGETDFIPWRGRTVDGTSYLIGYGGGASSYDASGGAIRVHWLKTSDGVTFDPAIGSDSMVLEGGASEVDWAFLPDGGLVAVGRNEEGDDDGFGSKICRAEAGALEHWTCRHDPKKYDSPLVFRHGDDVYLVGRRNVTETGNFDLMQSGKTLLEQRLAYQLAYWQTPKRCSLWQLEPNALTVSFVLDLPSAGDTCFASELAISPTQHLLYNYTSDPNLPDLSWNDAQHGPTRIDRVVVTLP